MSIDKALERLASHEDEDLGKGAKDADIAAAEKALGLQIQGGYRAFLLRHGWCDGADITLYGVGKRVPEELDLVRNTRSERDEAEPPMPAHLLPVMNDGAGNHYCLDSKKVRQGEPAVVFWDHEQDADQTPEVLAPSFARWLEDQLDDFE